MRIFGIFSFTALSTLLTYIIIGYLAPSEDRRLAHNDDKIAGKAITNNHLK